MKRATMEDIKFVIIYWAFISIYKLNKIELKSKILCRNHEWFKKDLPAYLFPSPSDGDASIIDMDAVNEVCEV